MTSAAFRTSHKFYTSRPPANCVAARQAWDWFAKTGPIKSLRLLDGYWGCLRPDDTLPLDEIDAVLVRRTRVINV